MRGIVLKESIDLSQMWMGRGPYLYANSHLMRFCLAYWDTVDYPQPCHLPPSVQDAAVFLDRSNVRASNKKNVFARVDDVSYRTFMERERQQPGSWSICGEIDPVHLRQTDIVENRGAFFKLMRCLPVPASNVPFDRICEFKRRHNSERLALLDAVSDLYVQAIQSPDQAFVENWATSRLQKAVAEQLSAARKSNYDFDLWDFEVRFNIPAAIATSATLFASTGSLFLSVFGGALGVHFGPAFSLKTGNNDRPTPYAYIGSMAARLEW